MTVVSFLFGRCVSRMSPKISDEQKEQRRQKILIAAKQVFIRKGYEPATMKDIVEETRMSQGWIYLYFQTKDEIFEALLEQMDKEHEQAVKELLATAPCIWDVIKTLLAQQHHALLLLPMNNLLPAFYEYFLTGWRDEERKVRLLKRYENGIVHFIKLVQLGVERGEFAPALPLEHIAALASSYQEGIMAHTLAIGPEKANTAMQLNAYMEYLKQLLKLA